MSERIENQESEQVPEPEGLPLDLYTNPGKYDADIPFWKRTVSLVRQYQNTRPQKRDALFAHTAAPILRDLTSLKHVFENLDLVAQLQTGLDIKGIQSQLMIGVETAASQRSFLPNWTANRIGELIRLGLDSKNSLKEVVEKTKVSLFNAPQNIEEAVDLQYNTAWAMVTTFEPEVREELVSILCYEKDWLNELSSFAFYNSLGAAGLTDDQHIKKFYAVCDARSVVANFTNMEKDGRLPLNSRRLQSYDMRLEDASFAWSYLMGREKAKWCLALEKKHLIRFRSINKYFENDEISRQRKEAIEDYKEGKRGDLSEATESLVEINNQLNGLSWPYDLKYDLNEPLRKMVNQFLGPQIGRVGWEQGFLSKGFIMLTPSLVRLTDELSILVVAQGITSKEQRNDLTRQVISNLLVKYQDSLRQEGSQRNKEIFRYALLQPIGYYDAIEENKEIKYHISRTLPEEEIGKLSSIIEYFRPIIQLEKIGVIQEQIVSLRGDIKTRFIKTLGKRGYQINISDGVLRDLGYQSIGFKQSGNNINVNITINQQTYGLILDSEYRIIPCNDIKRFQSPQDKVWLELLVLSHLKSLICTSENESELKAELIGGERQYERYRRQIGRSEHLRKQTPGPGYRTRAFELCLKSNFRVKNLYLINKMRAEIGWGGTKETGIWTYVSGSEYEDTPDAKPIRVAFKNASEDMRKVIDLGEVSQEELNRLEKEILGELEIQ